MELVNQALLATQRREKPTMAYFRENITNQSSAEVHATTEMCHFSFISFQTTAFVTVVAVLQ